MEREFSTEELKEAGASDAFVSCYLSAASTDRHHIRQELDSGYAGDVLGRGGDPTDAAGGFFTKLWNGNVFKAFLHADGHNAPHMLSVLGPEKIMENGIDVEGYGYDYAKRMINEKSKKYGYDTV
jgi:hypothetical protein